MDGATISARVWMGYGKAALYTGTHYMQYRPVSPFLPMTTAYGSQYAVFDAANYTFTGPEDFGKATWRALIDGRFTQPMDILTGMEGTFYIASQDPMLPIFVVRCNSTVDVWRSAPPSGVGAIGYGGDVESSREAVMTGWPASILQGAHTPEKSWVDLPGDQRMPWKSLLLPSVFGVAINTNDFITDSTGLRYQVSDAELTPLGWRIAAALTEA